MQNSNEPVQQTDKNKGDQSAAEQQQKETLKKPSPENMSGAENAQQTGQADQQVTGGKPHTTNNDGAPINPSGKGNEDVNMESNRQDNQRQDKDKNQANKGNMGDKNKSGMGGSGQGEGSSRQGQ